VFASVPDHDHVPPGEGRRIHLAPDRRRHLTPGDLAPARRTSAHPAASTTIWSTRRDGEVNTTCCNTVSFQGSRPDAHTRKTPRAPAGAGRVRCRLVAPRGPPYADGLILTSRRGECGTGPAASDAGPQLPAVMHAHPMSRLPGTRANSNREDGAVGQHGEGTGHAVPNWRSVRIRKLRYSW
jgi:hypothetical protein